jgi:hypothetical protein
VNLKITNEMSSEKLDKNLNSIKKVNLKMVEVKNEELEYSNSNLKDSVKNFGIFGENDDDLRLEAAMSSQNSKNKSQKPQSLLKVTPSTSNSKSGKVSKKNSKIKQFLKAENDLNYTKIPIQKSQTSPGKSLKSLQKSPQIVHSSYILDDKEAKQLKLKISKSENSQENTKKPRQRRKPKNNLESLNKIKQESMEDSIVKSELEIPLHLLPDNEDLKLIGYEPKITKKRKEIRLECDHCEKVFKSKYSIIWHMKEHMLTMPFNCKVCGKGFSYERSFKQHELTHAAKVKCEICGKSLKPHAMYYHMKYRHTNEKTHQCPLCPKAFKTKDNIARHMMRHNMEFPCTICGRKFAENSRLQMHLNMHENPDAFFCSICNKSFEHIDRHMKRLHVKKRERNLKCQYCEYASDSKQTLRRHEEMHEKRNEILQSKTRKRKIKLKIIDMKTFECKVCNVVLQTKSGYKSHLRHYHKGKDQVNAIIANEIKDESSMESEEFVEIKVEKEEISVIQ